MQYNHTLLITALAALTTTAFAQRQTDRLDRGLVAVQTSEGVYCSWRIQADEYYDTQYNLYRNGVKVNDTPLSVSNLLVTGATDSDTFTVRAIHRGEEHEASSPVQVWQKAYLEITPKHDASLTSTYVPNDACCADVDGDGQVEILLKYDNQSEINASYPKGGHNGEYSLFECLKLDGTVLWWVNCGPNMGDFQNNEQNIVAYDWDGDGRAEAIFRAADGTTIHMADGSVYTVGDASLNYRAATGGGTNWFMHSGAEFLLYVDGQTGQPYQCIDYPLPRLEESENPNHLLSGSAYDDLVKNAWGDGYGHRSSKHFFGAPYLDGQKPSIFLGRGIYTQHKFVTYDVDPSTHELVERWRWSNKNPGPWYAQGYHNYSIADVDWDGRDEIVWGSMVIDDNGLGLSTTGLGHGDAHHVGDFNPYIHGQEGFFCNEDQPANNYRDLTTSQIYYRMVDTDDAGRSMAGNFTDLFPGAIGWSAHDTPISLITNDHVEGMYSTGLTQNFRIYWDGDLLEECVDGGSVYKYGKSSQLIHFEGGLTNNSTKATPCFQGDILGDWREEVIERTVDNKIRIYTTTEVTPWRNYSLWYDHQYRNAMVWQMCGYNQPPHVSYFLGEREGITMAPPPLTTQGRVVLGINEDITTEYDGQHVLVSDYCDRSIGVHPLANPAILTVNVPSSVRGSAPSNTTQKETPIYRDLYHHTLTIPMHGETRLVKQGDGILTLMGNKQEHSGPTDVWAGILDCHGSMTDSRLWLNRFAELHATSQSRFSTIQADYASVIQPAQPDVVGSIYADSLLLGFGARVVFDIANGESDNIDTRVLCIETKDWSHGPQYQAPVFQFICHDELAPGRYAILSTLNLIGNLQDVVIEGLNGIKTSLIIEEGITNSTGDDRMDGVYQTIYLDVAETRPAEEITWTGAECNLWDLDNTPNFASSSQTFVSGDTVTFDDSALRTEVQLVGELSPASVQFSADTLDFTLTGSGSLTGSMNLVKQGASTLKVLNVNRYTGQTQILGGTIEPATMANRDGQAYGALGGVNNGILLDNQATLRTTTDMTSSQGIKLGLGGGTLDITGTFIQNGAIQKQHPQSHGNLYKVGTGTLQLDGTLQCDSLFINRGTVYDFADNHFDDKTIVFGNNGTLRYSNSIYSYSTDKANFYVPEGCTGTLYADGRCDYNGKLTGSGTLNLHATWVRLYFQGDWSNFTGTIKAFQDGKTGNYDPTFEFNNSYGLGLATLNIQSGCTVYTNGKNFAIGELTGSGSIRNDGAKGSGTNTLTIGGKNTDFSYTGTIVGSRVKKVGEGRWSVTSTSVLSSAGAVTIEGGSLYLNSTNATSTMTGTNALTIADGASILGKGVVQSLVLNSGATYRPGTTSSNDTQSGTVRAIGNIQASAGSHIYLNKVNKNNTAASRSWIETDGKLILNGTVHISARASYAPAEGDSATFFIAKQGIEGNPTFEVEPLPDGFAWDLSTLMQDGIARIVASSGIYQLTNDAEPSQCRVYDLAGHLVATFHTDLSEEPVIRLQQQGLRPAVYLLHMQQGTQTTVRRVVLH